MTSLSSSAKYLLSDDNGIRQFQDARALFETDLARDAARSARARDIRHLSDALDANYKSIGDIRHFEDSNFAFHYAIACAVLEKPRFRREVEEYLRRFAN
jgi:GntR family transcriptional repressor for pyruvate dehydrogenase complex